MYFPSGSPEYANNVTELLNSHFVRLAFQHLSYHLLNVLDCHSVISRENDSLPYPTRATELGWILQTPVILSLREATSTRVRAWILLQDLLVLVVWRLSGR
jgi:hypothetical protein